MVTLGVACSGDSGTDGSDEAATSTALPQGLTPAEVTRVIDGDTIEVEVDGVEYTVRYIGIDTPESVDPRRPVECFAEEASERNKELVDGRTVGLEKDVSETDAFGRLLRYVWFDDRLINARLVSEGYALAATYPPDVRYAELFSQLQAEARATNLGLWNAGCDSATSTPTVGPTAQSSAPASCDFSDSAEPKIKGNISIRTAEKIYHVPGGEFYEDTRIETTDGERWFCTETEAITAGWRRSMR